MNKTIDRVNKKQRTTESAPAIASVWKKHLFAGVLLSVSISLAYSNSLNGTWAMDDVVANNPVGMNDLKDFVGFRKIAYITFLLTQSLGTFSPINFRLFNIAIHLLNTLLVYAIAYLTMSLWIKDSGMERAGKEKGESPVTSDNFAFPAALFSGILFGLHPININAVAYIVQRMASLATCFVLIAVLCYMFAERSGSRQKAALFYVLTCISILAGIFSKENAVLAVPLIILYDFVFLARCKSGDFAKRAVVIGCVGVLSIGLAAYLLKLHVAFFDIAKLFSHPNEPIAAYGWTAVDVYWTPLQHFITEFRVLSRYLFLIVAPLPQLLVFDWWGFPVSQGLTQPFTTLLSLLFLSFLLVFSLWKIKRFPMLCFGILWYLIAISLESFLALGSDLYFEHRNYLPVSGLFIGIAGQAVVLFKGRIKGRTLWATAIVICMVLGSLTFMRNFVWKDSITLWGDTCKKSPSNIRAIKAMGNAYLRVSDFDNAERYYKQGLKLSQRDRRRHLLNDAAYSLGMVYLFKGELPKAKELMEGFDYRLESYRPKILRGFYKALSNDLDGALNDYRAIVDETVGIDKVVVLTLMGDACRKKGLWNAAEGYYRKAISFDPGFAASYHGMGLTFLGQRDLERAYQYFSMALSIEPNNVLALSDMADLLLIGKSRPGDALVYAEKAVEKSPPFHQPYFTMANVLITLGKEEEAEKFYKRAVERSMPAYMVPFGKARAYYIKGDTGKARYYLSELRLYENLPDNLKGLISGNAGPR